MFSVSSCETIDATSELFKYNSRLVLIHAWNPLCFIGNLKDHMVAGSPPNDNLKNTSYLHNPCFHPTMQDPTNWIEIEREIFQEQNVSSSIKAAMPVGAP